MVDYRIVPLDGITRTTVEGALDFEASAGLLHALADENEAAGRHLLVDLRDADARGLSYTDVHRLVQMLDAYPASFQGRIAMLDTFQEGFEKVQFFEVAAEVGGYHVRSFLDEGAAVRWLEGKTL